MILPTIQTRRTLGGGSRDQPRRWCDEALARPPRARRDRAPRRLRLDDPRIRRRRSAAGSAPGGGPSGAGPGHGAAGRPGAAAVLPGRGRGVLSPQCSGPEIDGWDWTTIELKETASDVTWGAFAVIGFWDGERFEVTEPPIPLALYDPMPLDPDPRLDPTTPARVMMLGSRRSRPS